MSERASTTGRTLLLPAIIASAALVVVALTLWAEHGEAVFLDVLAAGFVGCFG